MTPQRKQKNWYDDNEKFDWESHEIKQYNKFRRKSIQLGIAICIITAFWTLSILVKACESLLND